MIPPMTENEINRAIERRKMNTMTSEYSVSDELLDELETFVTLEIYKYDRNPDISFDEMVAQEHAIWTKMNEKYGYGKRVDYAMGYDICPAVEKYHGKR